MSFNQNLSCACFFMLLVLLSSCSATHQAYLRTLKLAFDDSPDIALKTSDIITSPVDLIYVKKGDFSTVVLALAFIENGRYKWISADKTSVIEQNGRIIKTLALTHNLDFITATTNDPLLNFSEINNASSWHRTIDFDSKHFGLQISSSFELKGQHILTIQEQPFETVLIEEHVKVIANRGHDFNSNEWLNKFWFNKTSGQIIRSKQKVVPDGEYFDITYVSRALRL